MLNPYAAPHDLSHPSRFFASTSLNTDLSPVSILTALDGWVARGLMSPIVGLLPLAKSKAPLRYNPGRGVELTAQEVTCTIKICVVSGSIRFVVAPLADVQHLALVQTVLLSGDTVSVPYILDSDGTST